MTGALAWALGAPVITKERQQPMNTSLEIQFRRAAFPLTTICILAFAAAALSLHARENEVEHQEIERSVRLMRTDAAPSNAVGTAQLEVGHRSVSRSNRIEIHTSGLAAGTEAR